MYDERSRGGKCRISVGGFAMHEIFIDDIHGINGFTPEDTMRHMGEIASPGMIGTEKTIVDILQEKRE